MCSYKSWICLVIHFSMCDESVFVSYCCITVTPKLSGLKKQILMYTLLFFVGHGISQGAVGMACLCSWSLGWTLRLGGLKSSAGLTEAGGSASEVVHSHGKFVGSGKWVSFSWGTLHLWASPQGCISVPVTYAVSDFHQSKWWER